MRSLPRRLLAAVTALALLFGACSSSEDESSSETTDDGAAPPDDNGETSACEDDFFEGEGSRVDTDNGHVAAEITGDDITSTAAVELEPGANYTVYLSTTEIDEGSVADFETQEAEAGEILVTLNLHSDGPIEMGDDLWVEGGFLIMDSGGGAEELNIGDRQASAQVTALDDDRICFEFDYADDVKELSGEVGAEILTFGF